MRVYLDHNATTTMREEVREFLAEQLDAGPANASSVHASGRRARALIDDARQRIAGALRVKEDEVLFTSGGTESNNLALVGSLSALGKDAGLVTTTAEHSSVREVAAGLKRRGHPLEKLHVDAHGRVDVTEVLAAATRKRCRLLSLMAANNEVGSTTPLETLGALLAELPEKSRPLFHSDGVQALGKLPLDLAAAGLDLASFSAHKVGGPIGVGVLVRRGSAPLLPVLRGGGQELGLRPGTENAAAIGAAALALELAVAEVDAYRERTSALTSALWEALTASIPDARLFGPPAADPARLPNTLCILFPGVDGPLLVARLDLEGLEVSAGSACSSGSLAASEVLMALGASENDARSALRLSLGRDTRPQDVNRAVDILVTTLRAVRATS